MSARKATRRPKARKATDPSTTPTEGMAAFLKACDDGAFTRPHNSLCARAKPLQILKACEELAHGQFNATFQNPHRVGEDHIWLMLLGALQSLQHDFTLLDKHARKCVGWVDEAA